MKTWSHFRSHLGRNTENPKGFTNFQATFCAYRHFRWDGTNTWPVGTVVLLILKYTLCLCIWTRSEISSAALKTFHPYPSPAVLTEAGRKKPYKLLKEQIHDRQSFSRAWLNSAVAGIVLGERNESTFQDCFVASLFSMAWLFNLK